MAEVPDEVAQRVAETRRYVIAQLRSTGEERDGQLADRLERKDELDDGDQVVVDAIIHGTGFMVDGKRVAPDRVSIVRWDGP